MVTATAPEVPKSFGQTIRVHHLGVILRVHRRKKYIRRILGQINSLGNNGGPNVTVLISCDRPTPAVAAEVVKQAEKYPDLNIHILPALRSVVSSEGLHWMAVLAEQYQDLLAIKGPPLDACMLWDDDALFTRGAVVELRRYMRCLEYDRVDALSLFLWDTARRVNTAFPVHWSTCLFRVYEGDQFPTDFEVHCPRYCARSTNVAILKNPWLNYGYMEPEERQRTFEDQKAAGKIDAHTLCLIRPPTLVPLDREYRNDRTA